MSILPKAWMSALCGGWGFNVVYPIHRRVVPLVIIWGLSAVSRSATIWVCGRTRDPYFVILGGHHSCLRVRLDTSSTLGNWHFWIFT